jgi:CheY-like chemotaxis protein
MSPKKSVPVPSKTETGEPKPTGSRSEHILIIDDDAHVSGVIRNVLWPEYEVEVLNKARLAIDAIRKSQGKGYDLILCDLMMPEMDGMEFFLVLEKEFPWLTDRVIFITGGAFTSRAEAFLRSLPNPRIEKPFSIKQIRTLIQSTLAQC